jgi:hypothetical protein
VFQKEGLYRNQFESGLTAGAVSAREGGDRDQSELSMFQRAYHEGLFDPSSRPKYGALDILKRNMGGAPTYGNCYFILKPSVMARCTFVAEDSGELHSPEDVGVLEHFEHLLLGQPNEPFRQLFEHFVRGKISPERPHDPSYVFNSWYVEAQVHGPVDLSKDVAALVADAAFKGTPYQQELECLARKYGIWLEWRTMERGKRHEIFVRRVLPQPSSPIPPARRHRGWWATLLSGKSRWSRRSKAA